MATEPEETAPATTPESEPASKAKKPGTKAATKKATAGKKEAAPAKAKAAAAKTRKTKTEKSETQKSETPKTGTHKTGTHKTGAPKTGTDKSRPKSKAATEESAAIPAAADASAEAEAAAYRAETADVAIEGTLEAHEDAQAVAEPTTQEELAPEAESDEDFSEAAEASEDEPSERAVKSGAPAKLDRLQKILSQAGIASRRRAEELITEGRVQVNGQVVNQLGAKADPARDHIRVDGKLISEAERHRYFVLNKPRGFVTTVSDPEGRPTVMQFFAKMKERLYPVGRLDYQSEGLLLVTNDGELANQLTRAASGVEKTYLVKVAGRPTEEELELLRSGVGIDREGPGSGKVHTAPAVIRQIRQGENPWFEVVLIEGRNRELRKMFSAVGHFVEKIRRVGYGPLILDLEPGKFRELMPEELAALRLAAEGKLKPRRLKTARMLPKEAGKPAEPFAPKRFTQRGTNSGTRAPERHGRSDKPFRGKTDRPPRREGFQAGRPGGDRAGSDRAGSDRARPDRARPDHFRSNRPGSDRSGSRRFQNDRVQIDRLQDKPVRNERVQNDRLGPDRTRNDGIQIERVQNDRPEGRSEFGRREGGESKRFAPRGEFRPNRERPFRGHPNADPNPSRYRETRGGSSFRPQQREQGAAGRSWDNRAERPPFKPQGESARRFDKPAGKSFGRAPFKPSFESGSKGPAQGRDRGEYGRPARSEGSTQAFRGKPGPHPGKANPPLGERSRPAFGSKPGGARPGGSRPASARTGGSRPGGARPGGARPGGARTGGARPNRSGPSGFKRSGPPHGGRKRG